jgi:hypothetical protein
MAQYLTLEEAAERLGISVSDFKRRLRTDWTHIRPMQDGSTQRFRDKDVEELARMIGFGSEEELTLADPSSSDEIEVPMNLSSAEAAIAPSKQEGVSGKQPAAKAPPKDQAADNPLVLGDQDVFLLADEEPKPVASGGSSSKGKSDSDVRLEKSGKRPKIVDSGTEEIDLATTPKGGSSAKGKSGKLTSTSSGKLGAVPKTTKLPAIPEDESSEFELRLDPDSSDEFELSLANDSSEEVPLGDLPGQTTKGKSGINIGKPSDSGKSLESKKKGDSGKSGKKSGKIAAVKPASGSEDEIDFELSLDQSGSAHKKVGSAKKVDSESEFELTLDEGDLAASLEAETTTFSTEEGEQKGDIFETDFEIPALDDDSASEAVNLEDSDTDLDSSSDFDLAIDESADGSVEDESASQVVVLDDETETPAKAKKKHAKKKVVEEEPSDDDLVVESAADEDAVSFDEMEVDESVSASEALEGVKDEGEEEEQQVVVVAGSAPWGPFPAIFLLLTLFVVWVAGIMGYELMQSMWGYHQSTKPSAVITNQVANMFDMKPNEGGAAGAGGAAK